MVSKQIKQLRRDYVKHTRVNRQNKAYITAEKMLHGEEPVGTDEGPTCSYQEFYAGDVEGAREVRFEGVSADELSDDPSKLSKLLNQN